MSQRRPSLVTLGDLLLDVVVEPERAIESGTDVPGRVTMRRGGSAANTAAAFARAGGRAVLITSLGDDGWAPLLVRSLRRDGVVVRAVSVPGPSGRLAALVDERGERSFVTQRAAADGVRATDVKAAWVAGADVLHVPAYSLFAEPIGRAATAAAGLARDAGLLVSCDLSSSGPLRAFGPRRSRSRLADLRPDILFANRDEVATLLQRPGRRAWPGLLRHAPLAVVKDGAWGCRVLRAGAEGSVRQLDVATARIGGVDTTGAGDAFAAGFLQSLVASGARDVIDDDQALRPTPLAGHRSAAAALVRGRPELGPT